MINISILIPLYNGIEYLDECISSINMQSYQNFEVIIGINGHDKNSDIYNQALIYANDKIKINEYIFEKDNAGYINYKSVTLNMMVNDVKYDYICILDVDDVWLGDKLKKQVDIIENNDCFDVIGTKCRYFGDCCNIPDIPKGNITEFDFIKVNPIINSSVLIKKEHCQWRTDTPLEDYAMWLELRKNNKKIYNIDEILVLHRIHEDSYFNPNVGPSAVEDLRNEYK
jgi:glycosyltransferase involved in cell wall biosynthesis